MDAAWQAAAGAVIVTGTVDSADGRHAEHRRPHRPFKARDRFELPKPYRAKFVGLGGVLRLR